jgi:hypothetical protein
VALESCAGEEKTAMSTTRKRALELLRGPVAARIRFSFPNRGAVITINRSTFERTAKFIEQGKVKIKPPTTLPPGAGASQNKGNNEIQMRRPTGRWDEASLLHECLHAFFDVTVTGMSATDEEAAAYVVTALYCRMTGLKQERWGEITRTARPIVDKILQHYAKGSPGVPAVNEADWNALRLTITLHPLYFASPAGLPRQLFPGWLGSGDYGNDG